MKHREQRIEGQLAIPVRLLDGAPQQRPWSNLGDWSEAVEYREACQALACRVGRAANLGIGDSVLDIACGHGASLSVWPEVFGVRTVDAMERQSLALASIESDRPPALRNLWQADVNRILSGEKPWPMDERYDAVVVVDAAYHFNELRTFLKACGSRLRPGGHIAFTTLIRGSNWVLAKAWQQRLVRELAVSALIPPANFVSEEELAGLFQAAGFEPPTCEILDREVLEGFVRFVARRRPELAWRQRARAGWWKVEATAAAARYLLRTGLLHYVLLRAVRI